MLSQWLDVTTERNSFYKTFETLRWFMMPSGYDLIKWSKSTSSKDAQLVTLTLSSRWPLSQHDFVICWCVATMHINPLITSQVFCSYRFPGGFVSFRLAPQFSWHCFAAKRLDFCATLSNAVNVCFSHVSASFRGTGSQWLNRRRTINGNQAQNAFRNRFSIIFQQNSYLNPTRTVRIHNLLLNHPWTCLLMEPR